MKTHAHTHTWVTRSPLPCVVAVADVVHSKKIVNFFVTQFTCAFSRRYIAIEQNTRVQRHQRGREGREAEELNLNTMLVNMKFFITFSFAFSALCPLSMRFSISRLLFSMWFRMNFRSGYRFVSSRLIQKKLESVFVVFACASLMACCVGSHDIKCVCVCLCVCVWGGQTRFFLYMINCTPEIQMSCFHNKRHIHACAHMNTLYWK